MSQTGVLTSWPNTALHSLVPADSSRPQTRVLSAVPGPRTPRVPRVSASTLPMLELQQLSGPYTPA